MNNLFMQLVQMPLIDIYEFCNQSERHDSVAFFQATRFLIFLSRSSLAFRYVSMLKFPSAVFAPGTFLQVIQKPSKVFS